MLKGQAKTDYQREYMRRKRGSNKGLTGSNIETKLKAVGLTLDGNKIVGVQPESTIPEDVQSSVPIYDPTIHKAGDRVLVKPQYGRSKKLIEMTIPELDADGNAMP